MAIRTEVSLRLPNSPGALSAVWRTLAEERVGVQAMTLEAGGTLRLLVDNPVHAEGTLRDRHYAVETSDVLYLVVQNDPMAVTRTLELIAEAGVNVNYAYGGALDSDGMIGIVAGVADPERASALAGV